VYAPVAGEVIAVNDALAGAPEKVNADAWAAWLFKLKPSDPSKIATLLDAAAYRASIGEA
jgi:glycine cleavage system H protein